MNSKSLRRSQTLLRNVLSLSCRAERGLHNPSPFAANVRAALANPTVMAAFNATYAVPHTAAQPTYLKNFAGYTMYQTDGL